MPRETMRLDLQRSGLVRTFDLRSRVRPCPLSTHADWCSTQNEGWAGLVVARFESATPLLRRPGDSRSSTTIPTFATTPSGNCAGSGQQGLRSWSRISPGRQRHLVRLSVPS